MVLKAIEQFEPNLAQRTRHMTHGNVKAGRRRKNELTEGQFPPCGRCSGRCSRSKPASNGERKRIDRAGSYIKYSFLKNRIGGDIIFIPEESVALEGNSRPCLFAVRTCPGTLNSRKVI